MDSPWQSVYVRFAKWRDDRTLERIFQALAQNVDMENLSTDSISIKVHPSANGGETQRINDWPDQRWMEQSYIPLWSGHYPYVYVDGSYL